LAYLVDIQVLTKDENQYIAALPVLGQSDLEMVNKARQLSWDIMKAWLTENYASIEAELKGLPAVSQGVPFEVMFTEVWHYIFGLTNRDLVAAGFFQDPYGQDRLHKGYMPSIWSKSLYDDFNPN
jgi:hypothetical protein